ncbi:MAG: dCMP deaminase family protein [archaeon]
MDRRDRPIWDQYFMALALVAATRSTCKHIHGGAILTIAHTVVGEGYNGAPTGLQNCVDAGCRKERHGSTYSEKGQNICIGVHAEKNALLNRKVESLQGATLYTKYYPCGNCAKDIVQAGIKKVVYSFHYKEPESLTEECLLNPELGNVLYQVRVTNEDVMRFLKNVKSGDEK